MFKIQTIDNISLAGLDHFSREKYEISSELSHPDAIIVRSSNLHKKPFPSSLKAVGRAGSGVNNIPVDKLTGLGIPVFHAPGANANAVKELVIAAMIIASRQICEGLSFGQDLTGTDDEITCLVEAQKKAFVGDELAGRCLAVIGLGAVGVKVCNAAVALGMKVIGYDPAITVPRAWELSSDVIKARSVDEVLKDADFVSLHVPLTDDTRNMIDHSRLQVLKKGVVILNFARDGVVHEDDMEAALNEGIVSCLISDFPKKRWLKNPKTICFPHMGASTRQAQDKCAIMVVKNIRDFLETGNVTTTVNFPAVIMQPSKRERLAIANANVPNMVAQISACLANAGLNIADLLNKSFVDIAYTLIDVDIHVPIKELVLKRLKKIDGVLAVRLIRNSQQGLES